VLAIVSAPLGALIAALRLRASLVVEILVLRQQLTVFKRDRPRPHRWRASSSLCRVSCFSLSNRPRER
jgi:hypothetical protein